ncbi:MAG: hypothetical protein KGS44_07760 [Alphaproteobacteria bacterium]|jgi:chromosomal replication initiation ATPase DnaA|nr:hypothetical protein [Alphaproteobacteria bacterium]
MADARADPSQPRLFAFSMGERDPTTHVVSSSNKAAADLLQRWRRWPRGSAVLSGPAGSGRTHLAQVWATAAEAHAWDHAEPAHEVFQRFSGKVLIDDADHVADEEALVRFFDLAGERGGAVLLVTLESWRPQLPDLASRIAAAPRALLLEPDPALLEVVLRRRCRDRFFELSDEAAAFLLNRMERSFDGAKQLADILDQRLRKGARGPVKLGTVRRLVSDMETHFTDDGDATEEEDAPP